MERCAAQEDACAEPQVTGGMELHPGERVWFSPSRLDGVEVLHARGSSRPWRVWHERYALAIVHAVHNAQGVGAAEWLYRGVPRVTLPGQLMLMEIGEWHVTSQVHGRGDFDVIEIDSACVQQVACELNIRVPVHLTSACAADAALWQAAQALVHAIDGDESALVQEQCLIRTLTLLFAQHVEGPEPVVSAPTKIQLARASEYLVEHHGASSLKLDDIAKAIGVSKSTICHAFPDYYGTTPMELLRVVRASRAKALLAQGMPASEVATAVGFYDQSKLGQHFRELFGIPPGRYARMMRR